MRPYNNQGVVLNKVIQCKVWLVTCTYNVCHKYHKKEDQV